MTLMDKMTKRIRCTPNGSILLKRLDDLVVVKASGSKGILLTELAGDFNPLNKVSMIPHEELLDRGWETEIDY